MTDKKNENVIQLKNYLSKRPLPEFDGLSEEQANTVINWFWNYIQMEVALGLNLVELNEEDEAQLDDDLYFFDKLEEMFDKSKEGCYFCDPLLDPNDEIFDPKKANVCMECQLRLGNFLQALGIDPRKVFKHIQINEEQPVMFQNLLDEE